MSAAGAATQEPEAQKRSFTDKFLDFIEVAGNKVPHPAMVFVYLILLVIVLSAVFNLLGSGVTEEILVPADEVITAEYDAVGGTGLDIISIPDEFGETTDFVLKTERVDVRSLLTIDGIRFMLTGIVNNFASFSVVAVIFIVMIGIGIAEHSGLMAASIRKLVASAPAGVLPFAIVFIGGISSVASDAGYLILIPLGGVAFLSIGRHPVAGIVAAYAGVSAYFSVNMLITPADAMLTEMTNEAIAIIDPNQSISITSNWFFGTVFTIIMAFVVTIVTTRVIEPRLGKYDPSEGDDTLAAPTEDVDPEAEARGLRGALIWLLGGVVFFALLTAPPGAPLRDPVDGSIIGQTPFMEALIVIITTLFGLAGIGYGIGAKTFKSSTDVINGIVKTFAGLGGLIFILAIISQFIAFFNYSNMPRVLAGKMAHLLERANVGALPLLIGFILVIALLDIIMPGSLPKWAIFAPVFVPIFMRLDVAPQTVLAAYRLGDSPMNVITPLMVYLPFIVLVTQRYMKNAGIGTIIALMMPYSIIVLVSWVILFIIWFLLGIPLGPGYPVSM